MAAQGPGTVATIAAAVLCFQVAADARAQIPDASLLKGGAKQGAGPPAETPFNAPEIRARVEHELSQLRKQLERRRTGGEPPPIGITSAEIEDARKSRELLAALYESQLDTLAQIEARHKARESSEKAEQAWRGFKNAPPYSSLLSDNISEELDTYRASVALQKSARAAIDIETEKLRDKAEKSEEAVRRAAEALERTVPGSAPHTAAAWRLQAARDKAKTDGEFVAMSNLFTRERDEWLATAQAELRLAERKRAAITGKVRISKADLEEARVRLEAERAEQEKELQSLIAASAQRLREHEQAARALEAVRAYQSAAKQSPETELKLKLAEARFRAADLRNYSTRLQIQILTTFVNLYHDRIINAWQERYAALSGGDPNSRQRAIKQLNELIEYLQVWSSRGKIRQNEVRTAIREQDQRVRTASNPAVEKYERDALETLRQLDSVLARQQAILASRLARLGSWQQEFSDSLNTRSLGYIAADLFARFKEIAAQIWNFELLTIEDKVEIGGQTVTTSRGITVGKSVGAMLLFLIGYRLMIFLSARAEKLLVRRLKIGDEQGRTLRRWANVLGVLVLLLITLNVARIPLTVFAFAGGALAIGIGFGTQTLIKNLISGMIVLVERHVRVGDIIEVEGVTGTVTSVNIRSSTVCGFDGVESMIPNSMLLEQKVTNWTLTNAHLRRIVKVGVAYGSPARDVARILAECAERHGVVLKEPAPRVIFEDFGDNALVFALYFWIDLTPATNALQVMSDLRFMIEKQLGEAGIAIAFPQRDVHLDASRPLRIEMVTPGNSPP